MARSEGGTEGNNARFHESVNSNRGSLIGDERKASVFPVAFFPPRRFLSSTARGKTERTREYTQALKISSSLSPPPNTRTRIHTERRALALSLSFDSPFPFLHSSRRNSSREHHENPDGFSTIQRVLDFPFG